MSDGSARLVAVDGDRGLRRSDAQPIVAGLVAAFVGFFGSFSVVLAGLHAIGADRAQSVSGLATLSIGMGVLGIVLSWRTRMPLSIAWSTPGAAVLIGAGAVHGGYPAALGSFVVSGALLMLAGLSRRFERLVTAIPAPIASALLAGVLLPVCLSPARSLVAYPGLTAPMVATWLLLTRFARRLAVPGAFAAAALALVIDGRVHASALAHPLLRLTAVGPTFQLGTVLSIAVPLFLVTMASQNLAGMTVLRLHGYDPPLGPVLTSTGAVSAISAPFGAHALNLAAITAALMAGPDGGPRPERRWIAAAAGGLTYVVLGLFAGLATGFVAGAPPVLIEAVAGLALLGALGGALRAATDDQPRRDAALVTLVITASGIAAVGLGAPFWGLVGGLVVLAVQRLGAGRNSTGSLAP
ncbi:MAG TPA: benzoate/H(+) symporter BenE family transporter [Solirubrobacteraceae bacterium]|jgi:benzoate membrane transport protein